MKNISALLAILMTSVFVSAQRVQTQTPWSTPSLDNKVFIENRGQYDGAPDIGSRVLFAIENPGEQIFFSKKGLLFLYRVKNNAGRKKESTNNERYPESREEQEEENRFRFHEVKMEWVGAENDVTVVAENAVTEEYGYYSPSSENGVLKCNAYKKIIFKNIYRGVDVEYTFHPQGGLKYNYILHPGANVSEIKMQYSGIQSMNIDRNGNIGIQTVIGKITDHAPAIYYAEQHARVASSFLLRGNQLSIQLESYDRSKEIVIDPWIVSPGFVTVDRGYDIARNPATGDIFVFGGAPAFQLKKFDQNGNLIYTFLTNPSAIYNSSGNYYGDMAIDPAGDVYLSSGCCTGNVIKINGTSQALIWTSTVGGEPWRLFYDAVNNVLIVGGALFTTNANLASLNSSTGVLINSITVSQPGAGAEIRTLCVAPDNNIYCLHVSSAFSSDAATNRFTSTSPAFAVNYDVQSGFVVAEEGAFYAYNDNPGLCGAACVHGFNGIVADAFNAYIYDGATIIKKNLATGAQTASVVVTGGVTDNNSGITMDNCGFIFVGTQTEIRKYDSTLTFVTAAPVTGAVYDLTTGQPGEILACGNGFLASVNFSCSAFSTTINHTNLLCNGVCTGTATANPTGGNSPYTYLWSTSPPQSSQTATSLCAGTYTVIVTDSTNATTTAVVVITEPAPLTIAISGPVAVCPGNSTTLSATTSGGTGTYTYLWTPGNATDSSIVVTPPATTTYTTTVTDANGCTATATVTVTVNSLPVIVTSSPAPICVGDSTVLTASGAATYLWSPCATLNPCTGNAVTASPPVTTIYTVTGTDANGCSSSSTVTVNVTPLPLVVTPPAPVICSGESVNLTLSGAAYYHWTPLTGITSVGGPDSSSVTISLTQTTCYTVTGYSAEGCSATTSFCVTVNPIPVPVIIPSGPTVFCPGDSVDLLATPVGTYLWSTLAVTQSIHVISGGTFTVTVTDNNNCSATTSQTITVATPPPAVVSPAGPVTICSANPVTLSANTGPGYLYQWFSGSNPIAGETNSQYSTLTTGTYSVVVTDSIGCSSTSNIVQVIQGTGPAVTIISPPTTGCLQNTIYIGYGPQEIQLCAQAAAGAVSYLWSTNDTTQCINVSTPGIYSVIAYDINGCPSPAPAVLNQPINVIDIRCGHGLKKILLCHVPEGQPGNPQTLCIGPPAIPPHLELHRYDCLGPCSLYYRNDNVIEAENFYVLSHPNPFNNGFSLTVLSTSSNSVTVNIHDMLGQIVETYTDVTEQTLLGTKLNAGIYFAEVIQDDNRQMIQIVKSE